MSKIICYLEQILRLEGHKPDCTAQRGSSLDVGQPKPPHLNSGNTSSLRSRVQQRQLNKNM